MLFQSTLILHHFVAITEDERRLVLRAIGPVWDGNEVWLVVAGGTLFFAFPTLYAVSFSGFYLPLMMVLWLLMLRAIGIELRGHLDDPLWRQFWDVVFAGASALLAICFGAAFGNVIRGVPTQGDKFFFEPLWTNFLPSGQTGILDWYTVLTGAVAFSALAAHGANYLALKTVGDVQTRARHASQRVGWVFTVFVIVSLVATLQVRPQMLTNYQTHRWGWVLPLLVIGSVGGMHYFRQQARDAAAFLSSAAAIAGLLGGAAFGLYPNVLPSTLGAEHNLTIWNTAAPTYGLRLGVIWWGTGLALAAVYFTYLYYSFRGKVRLESDGY